MASFRPQDSAAADVVILGGGLIGLVQALSLAQHGLRCAVAEQLDADTILGDAFDGRTSAIVSTSWNMLQALGLDEKLNGHGCAVERISVREGPGGKPLDFEPEDDVLGYIFENRFLRRTLYEAARAHPLITLYMGARVTERRFDPHGASVILDDGTHLNAPLIVAADGRNSPTREQSGIHMARWRYDHSAIVTAISHNKPHDHVAHEIFVPSGPFALLPMQGGDDGGHRSSVIWTVGKNDGAAMLKLSERGFVAEMRKLTGDMLGKIKLAAPRSSYPLGLHHTTRMVAPRLALVGDSAHGIHPIAGQGLNLGLRDVAALTQVLVEGARLGLDTGDVQMLERYEKWRGLDTLTVAAATDGLTRLFGLPGKLPSTVRKIGFAAVGAMPALKNLFMEEARGKSGERPRLLKGIRI